MDLYSAMFKVPPAGRGQSGTAVADPDSELVSAVQQHHADMIIKTKMKVVGTEPSVYLNSGL